MNIEEVLEKARRYSSAVSRLNESKERVERCEKRLTLAKKALLEAEAQGLRINSYRNLLSLYRAQDRITYCEWEFAQAKKALKEIEEVLI